MGIILVLIFFHLNIIPTFQEKVASDMTTFKQMVNSFTESVRLTEKKIQGAASPAQPTCTIAKFSQTSVENGSAKVAMKFKRNVEYLDALCAFTNNRYVSHFQVKHTDTQTYTVQTYTHRHIFHFSVPIFYNFCTWNDDWIVLWD